MDALPNSLAAGVVIALMCFLGLFGLPAALIPLPAIVPILLYIGLLIGAIAAFVIDKRYYWAAGYCVAGVALSFIGLIHGEEVAWAANPGAALGYLFAAAVCLAFSFGSTPAPVQPPDEHYAVPQQPGPAEVAAEPAR